MAVAALTPDRIERLRAVFWDMCQITTETETAEGEDSIETILHITITPKTAEDMRTVYSFSEFKNLGAHFQKIIKIKRGKSLAIKGFYLFVQFYLYSLIIS